ncbi:MAG: hypothetical protein DCF21_17415, partial [Leptolyngbya sp.]
MLGDRAGASSQAHRQAEQEWLGGLTALIKLLIELPPAAGAKSAGSESSGLESAGASDLFPLMGGVLSGPFPVLPDRLMGQRLSHWLLVPAPLEQILSVAQPLLPGQGKGHARGATCDLQMVPLSSGDPLLTERFC